MRKPFATVCVVSAVLALACNRGPSGSSQPEAKPGTEATGKSPTTPDPGQPRVKLYRPHKLEGSVVLQSLAKEPAQTEATYKLIIDEQKRVSGSLSIGADRLQLSGYRDNGHLRCWISPPPAARSAESKTAEAKLHSSLAGVLFATTKGDTFTGTIALSGNGGSPILRGSFEQALK